MSLARGKQKDARPQGPDYRLFLNKDGDPISERMVRKIMVKYKTRAGITKKANCHSLRHTFATYKAERGVSPFQLQQWLRACESKYNPNLCSHGAAERQESDGGYQPVKRKRSPTGRRPGRPRRQTPHEFDAAVLRIVEWAIRVGAARW